MARQGASANRRRYPAIVMPGYRTTTSGKDRTVAAVAVVAVHAALLALILSQHQARQATTAPTDTALIDITEPPLPPPPAEVRTERPKNIEGAAGKRAEPTEVVAPPAKLPAPSPVAAAPVAGAGVAPASGAANSGSGTGAGGEGSGTGGGGGGTGAQWISGGLRDSDYPREALDERLGGTVSVRFTVLTTGRIANCRVARSSGNSSLDSTTCRLLTERLRFRPATDGSGRAVESSLGSDFTWGVRVRH